MKLTFINTMLLGAILLSVPANAWGEKNCDCGMCEEKTQFVRSGDDGEFYIGDKRYRYVGTNFWYGAILGSQGRGGDRDRLVKELDLMKSVGIDNVRVLVGGDGEEGIPAHIMPTLQTAPGVYNDTILDGLDFMMAELEKRDMKAVLYLNNAWEWSGGYGTYLEWTGAGRAPLPSVDGYRAYVDYVKNFVHSKEAREMALNHAKNMVSRTNRYTGKPYKESPAIMSWQIANEPRAFSDDDASKEAFTDFLLSTAKAIKEIDPNHMVSTGSEGLYGCQVDIDLWERIHNDPLIDYGILHLWPLNWEWIDKETVITNGDVAKQEAYDYIKMHTERTKKPLVLEEFGYPRDDMSYSLESTTKGRDAFYKYIFDLIVDSGEISGCNFWGWGGYAVPAHDNWQPWDPYTGDPAQEPQGLNSVFATDTSTLEIIRSAATAINNK